MSEPEELASELVLEDNYDFKDDMAEPYGAARHPEKLRKTILKR